MRSITLVKQVPVRLSVRRVTKQIAMRKLEEKHIKAPKLCRTHQLAQPRAEEAGLRGKQVRRYETASSKSVSSEDSQGDEPEESE